MSQLSSTANQPGAPKTQQKQRINVYTMMLIVAFIAICLACVGMYLELEKYGKYPWWDTNEANPSTAPAPAPTSSLRLKADAQLAWHSNKQVPGDLERLPRLAETAASDSI